MRGFCLSLILLSVKSSGPIFDAEYIQRQLSSDNPVRPRTEADFDLLNHHERSANMSVTYQKIKTIRNRRRWPSFDSTNPDVQKLIASVGTHAKKPNILLLLADDLGYADLSVPPFTKPMDSKWVCSDGGVLTANLEQMASNGLTLTNFHSASPVCSPSRVAIMTALYPWRLNAMNAFELGRDMSQRNGFLPQVPNIVGEWILLKMDRIPKPLTPPTFFISLIAHRDFP
jgi:hypothetical protein